MKESRLDLKSLCGGIYKGLFREKGDKDNLIVGVRKEGTGDTRFIETGVIE